MKKTALLPFLLALCLGLTACGSQQAKAYHLNEDTFFLVMTNAQYYPEQYLGKDMSFDSTEPYSEREFMASQDEVRGYLSKS